MSDGIMEPGERAELRTSDARSHLSPNQCAWRRFRANRLAVVSVWCLLILIVIVVVWPLMLTLARSFGASGAHFAQIYDPNQVSNEQFQPPSLKHWWGTDVHGR